MSSEDDQKDNFEPPKEEDIGRLRGNAVRVGKPGAQDFSLIGSSQKVTHSVLLGELVTVDGVFHPTLESGATVSPPINMERPRTQAVCAVDVRRKNKSESSKLDIIASFRRTLSYGSSKHRAKAKMFGRRQSDDPN